MSPIKTFLTDVAALVVAAALPPKSVTSDLPCLVVDGIKNLTYHVE